MAKLWRLLIVLGLVLSLAFPVQAVNTIRKTAGVIELTAIDSDWSYTTTEMAIHSIIFIPGAVDDRCIIRDGSATAAVFFDSNKAIDAYDPKRVAYDGKKFKPYLKAADGQYAASARVIIIIDR